MTDAERITALEATVLELRRDVARALSASSNDVDELRRIVAANDVEELRRTVALLVSAARHKR